MSPRLRRAVLALLAVVYFLGLGFLLGTLVERWRFDSRRTAVLDDHAAATRRWREMLMEIERGVRSARSCPPC